MCLPLVTVVIPTYKRPTMLKRAIESVLKQTYKNIEIIVVDDNNPNTPERDQTSKVIEKFRSNDNIIYIMHRCNKNGSAARNTGWRAARGKYITFLDDDDEISPQKVEKQVNCLEQLDDSWGACYTAYHVLRPDGGIQKSSNHRTGNVYIQALMRTLFMGSGSNLLLRKNVVDEVQGYDESFRRNQDIEFMVRVFEKYKLGCVLEDLLTIHLEVRQFKYSFEFLDKISQYYLERFGPRIQALYPRDRRRVIDVISLERCRVAFSCGKFLDGLKILVCNRVGLLSIIEYVFYVFKRIVTKCSYGFV